MELFDTHTHLDDARFDEDRDQVIRRMQEQGITRCMCIGADMASSRAALELAKAHEGFYAAVGVHPHDAENFTEDAAQELLALCREPKVRAVGEIGLDYHYDLSPRQTQRDVFRRQIALAREAGLPMVLHIREAHGDALEILRAETDLPAGVVHCYSGSLESAREYMRLGLLISFTGSVTFKNAHNLQAVAAVLPREKIMIETDCPYMAPTPYRGRRNEPALVAEVLRFLADLRGESEEELARTTMENGRRLFGID